MTRPDQRDPCTAQRVFVLGGIVHVPHYAKEGFVSPGYGRHHMNLRSADELIAAGAKEETRFLWERPKYPQKETTQ